MKRIPSLDGLRAISIVLVILGHLAKSGHAPRVFWSYYAAVGVQIFFIISGFLITGILLSEHERTGNINLKNFYIRRSLRIFPAAIVFMLVAFAMFWPQLRWYNMVAALLYVANHDHARPWILGHLWSLSIEEQFYMLWPSVLKHWYRQRTRILIGVLLCCPGLQAVLYGLGVRGGGGATLFTIGDNLAVGCLLAIFAPKLPRLNGLIAILAVCNLVLIPLFAANTPVRTLFQLFLLRPVFYVSIAALLLHVIQRPYRLLNFAPIAWLGQISYSLYLWQQPFCSNPHMRTPWMAAFAFVFACASFYLIEKPVLRLRETCFDSESQNVSKNEVSHILQVITSEQTASVA